MTNSEVLLINGPNLGCLGKRQPEVYGSESLTDIEKKVTDLFAASKVAVRCLQSNHEGILVDFLNAKFLSFDTCPLLGIIINPGAFTHTSIALRDALEMFHSKKVPLLEVHLSNVFARESFRHHSYISGIATGVICGLGTFGYEAAAQKILRSISHAP